MRDVSYPAGYESHQGPKDQLPATAELPAMMFLLSPWHAWQQVLRGLGICGLRGGWGSGLKDSKENVVMTLDVSAEAVPSALKEINQRRIGARCHINSCLRVKFQQPQTVIPGLIQCSSLWDAQWQWFWPLLSLMHSQVLWGQFTYTWSWCTPPDLTDSTCLRLSKTWGEWAHKSKVITC